MSLSEQDYILLIMNCEKYRPKALMQKNTWLRSLPHYLKYYHVIGNPNLDSDSGFLFDEVERVLYVKTQDDYNSLPKKVIASYEAVKKTFNYKYIFKTDDDQTLANIRFFDMAKDMVERLEPKVHYGGNVIDVKEAHISKYYMFHPELPKDLLILPIKYCSGRFYFLSKDAVDDLLNKKTKFNSEFLEDYSIGLHLDETYKSNVLNIHTSHFFKDIY